MPIEIIPSILTNDPLKLTSMLEKCEGVVERVSVDIIDGKFVDNKTIEPDIISDVETTLKIDFQLMVVEPVHWVEKCIRGQADRIIGHIEKMESQADFVAKVQEVGALIGLGLNLGTDISEIDSEVFSDLDVVLLMSSKVGFGGLPFAQEALNKIKSLAKIRGSGNFHFRIQVDGGINQESIYNVYKAQADEVSIGSMLFVGDLALNIEKLRKEAEK